MDGLRGIIENLFESILSGWVLHLVAIAITMAILIVAGAITIKIVNKLLSSVFKITKNDKQTVTVGKLVQSVTKFVVWFIVVVTILSEIGIDVTAIIASAGVIAFAFGFGAQEVVKDFIGGFFLVVENTVYLGDVVEIDGFKGEVVTTAATVELARLVMLDSAGLQEEEARYQARRASRRKGNHHEDIEPLYTTLDALNSLDYFGRKVNYDQALQLVPGIRATFIDAGHILGSASIFLELEEDGSQHRLLFSGDLGYSDRAILRNPSIPPKVDTVVMETTYGDRLHKQLQPSIDELYDIINETMGRGGNIIIPTFALERAQEILYYLREGIKNKSIKHFTNVFLDSPMAISATQIFERHPECYDKETLSKR